MIRLNNALNIIFLCAAVAMRLTLTDAAQEPGRAPKDIKEMLADLERQRAALEAELQQAEAVERNLGLQRLPLDDKTALAAAAAAVSSLATLPYELKSLIVNFAHCNVDVSNANGGANGTYKRVTQEHHDHDQWGATHQCLRCYENWGALMKGESCPNDNGRRDPYVPISFSSWYVSSMIRNDPCEGYRFSDAQHQSFKDIPYYYQWGNGAKRNTWPEYLMFFQCMPCHSGYHCDDTDSCKDMLHGQWVIRKCTGVGGDIDGDIYTSEYITQDHPLVKTDDSSGERVYIFPLTPQGFTFRKYSGSPVVVQNCWHGAGCLVCLAIRS